MKKIILLTTALLSSISAYAVCTPPTTLKCNCAHPIIENGVLACGASYCGDKKCMPDGSCCESEKYCEVGDNKYCCADGQTCDTTKGCVETVNECLDGETPCSNELENWCCNNTNSCGENADECCVGSFCCEGIVFYGEEGYACCPKGATIKVDLNDYTPTGFGDMCCPEGKKVFDSCKELCEATRDGFTSESDTKRLVCEEDSGCACEPK